MRQIQFSPLKANFEITPLLKTVLYILSRPVTFVAKIDVKLEMHKPNYIRVPF